MRESYHYCSNVVGITYGTVFKLIDDEVKLVEIK